MKSYFFILLAIICVLPVLPSTTPDGSSETTKAKKELTEEDLYINYFDNDPNRHYRMWSAMKKVYYEEHNETLTKLCADTYRKAKNTTAVIKSAYIHPKIIGFRDEKYYPQRTDIVTCEIKENHVISAFHITEGRRPDCVYFVEPVHSAVMDFLIGDLVCDIPIDEEQ